MKINFKNLDISKDILKGIENMNFTEMTEIQEKAIPIILDGKDLIGQAQTGTGKTAAFGIPALEAVDERLKETQVLILCPTRELSIQVAGEIDKICKFKRGVRVVPIYGGQSMSGQIGKLKRGAQIVVGTPGRIMDHMRRKTLNLEHLEMVILDEADEMFDMGFRDDMEFIIDRTPKDRQTLFFSATMPKDIVEFAKKYQKKPEIIRIAKKELTTDNIEQLYFNIKENSKTETLTRLIDLKEPKLSIVFCNTKSKVDQLTRQLSNRGYSVDGLHGDLNQNQRDLVMSKFRNGNIDILVATDIAARGIDVDDVDIVFNYDIPRDDEAYVHRIGRTGRAGRDGIAYSFVTQKDNKRLRNIERYAKTKIKKDNVPTVEDLRERQIENTIDDIVKNLDKAQDKDNEEILHRVMGLGFGPYEIATALIGMELDKNEYETIDEIKELTKKDNVGKGRIFINVGRKDRVGPGNILAALIEETGVTKDMVGSIDIFDKFSFADIDEDKIDIVLDRLNGKKINKIKVSVEKANKK